MYKGFITVSVLKCLLIPNSHTGRQRGNETWRHYTGYDDGRRGVTAGLPPPTTGRQSRALLPHRGKVESCPVGGKRFVPVHREASPHTDIDAGTLEVLSASQKSHLLNQQSRLVLMRNNEPSLNNNSLDGFHLRFRIYCNGWNTNSFSKLQNESVKL